MSRLSRLFTARTRPARPVVLGVEALGERVLPATTMVGSTTGYPNAATVKIEATWDMNRNGRMDAGETFVGTGAILPGGFHVLSAGHVIYDNDPSSRPSGFATWVKVIPGMNGSQQPFGSAAATQLRVPTSWTSGHRDSDLGLLTLNRRVGTQTGTFGYAAMPDSQLRAGTPVQMLHYPASEGYSGVRQYYSSGPVSHTSAGTFSYRETHIRSVGGSSGAPVYSQNVTIGGVVHRNPVIVGVNVRSDTGTNGYATSIRLTSNWVNWITTNKGRDAAPRSMAASAAPNTPAVGLSTPADALTKPSSPDSTRLDAAAVRVVAAAPPARPDLGAFLAPDERETDDLGLLGGIAV